MSVEQIGRDVYRVLRTLVDMPEDSFVILLVEASRNRFVQFASEGNGALWGEVVSNQFLDENEFLSEDEEDRLIALGWHPPGIACGPRGEATGLVNYYREWPAPADIQGAACLAAVTLRDVFGVTGPEGISVDLEEHEEHGEDDWVTSA